MSETAPPALFEHCCTVYDAMLSEAKQIPIQEPVVGSSSDIEERQELEQHIIVYEGFLTKLFSNLHISVPYYTTVRTALMNMGCIKQLRRGGSSSPSQWEMIYEPTLEAFMKQKEPTVPKQTSAAEARQLIRTLNARVQELEDWQSAINDLLAETFGTETSA